MKVLFLTAALLLALTAACGGGASPKAEEHPDPEEALRQIIDTFNRGDVDGFYRSLTADRRKDTSPDRLRGILQTVRRLTGETPQITLDEVEEKKVAGDLAEIEGQLTVKVGPQRLPVRDTAFLQWEEDAWHLADHFLETAFSSVGIFQSSPPPRPPLDGDCRTGDVLTGVWAPVRLKILDPCITVEGAVYHVVEAGDGDYTFDLELDDKDKRLLNQANRDNYQGRLHIEIIPMDRGHVLEPKEGDRVRISGAWVTDLTHGHNEIHPAWKVERLP